MTFIISDMSSEFDVTFFFYFTDGTLIVFQLGFLETTNPKAFHSQTNKGWESTLVYGMLMIGQQEVVLLKLIGQMHHLLQLIEILDQELAIGMDQ